jgi:glycosyltransferase involved in cell wall biosynthesis
MASLPQDLQRVKLVPPVAPCVVSHNLALGGAQIAVLRLIQCLPDWVRERTTLYCQSDDMPVLDAAVKHGFAVGAVTTQAPADPSCWVLSYGNLRGLPQRPTSLILHSWDDEGWRYVTRTYGDLRGLTVAGVSRQVLNRFSPWIEHAGHSVAGVLPPPVTEFTMAKGRRSAHRIVVAWMGRPLESKGLLSLPHLLKLDPRLVVRAWTGADTGGNAYTRRVQAETMEKLIRLAVELKVQDRLDLRPLSFDPFNYRERLKGAHVLLGNSRREGFLMTAAEALSCGVPVVVSRTCGVAEFVKEGVNGCLIDWDDDAKRLAKTSYDAILRAAKYKQMDCLQSVQDLSTAARYRRTYGDTLARLTHTSLRCEEGQARVTVGLRIHKGMSIESLDQAASSLAMQTYRQFKTVLLVDGPWAYGEKLAERYDLPLICTGEEPDITHCSWLHRKAVEQCDTHFYKPLDYDDQLTSTYLERAVATLDSTKADVYGCLLMTLEAGEYSPRWWPNKPVESMFTGKSDDNQLPHSSVLMRTSVCRAAGNYNERAVGLGADDYNLWYRIHKAGGTFVRDDAVRNVVYRIHEKNSLKIRKARYGGQVDTGGARGKWVAGAAAAASVALWAAPNVDRSSAALPPAEKDQVTQTDAPSRAKPQATGKKDEKRHASTQLPTAPDLVPPHS